MNHTKRHIAILLLAACLIAASCTPHTNPLEVWKPLGPVSLAPVPETIRRDAFAYFRSLPAHEREIFDRDDGALGYWEDGKGQHAMVLNAPDDGERWQYAIIYDRDNQRVKILKYSIGSYSS